MPTKEKRRARIEAALEHVATKEDVQGLRTLPIRRTAGSGIGAAGPAATPAAALMRFPTE